MNFETPDYFDPDAAVAGAVEKAWGLGEHADRAEESAELLHTVLQSASPLSRTTTLELFARWGENPLWDMRAGAETSEADLGRLTGLSSTVRTALVEHIRAKRAYAEARWALPENSKDRETLIAGAKKCRKSMNNQAVADYLSTGSYERLGFVTRHLQVLEAIENNQMNNGYELEVMKRHFYETVGSLYGAGFLDSDAIDPSARSAAKERAALLLKRYQRPSMYLSRLHISQLQIAAAEEVVPAPVEPVEDYFDYYLNLHLEQKFQRIDDYYGAFLTPSDEPRLNMTFEDAAENLEIAGSIPQFFSPDELWKFLESCVPGFALAACSRISFLAFNDREARVYDSDKNVVDDIKIGGLYRGEGAIDINTRHIHSATEMREVAVHEIGHAFMDALRLYDLDEFEKARDQEPHYVTEYVEWSATHQPDTLALEDFAESFKLFLIDRDNFQQQFPARHAVLAKIFADFENSPAAAMVEEAWD